MGTSAGLAPEERPASPTRRPLSKPVATRQATSRSRETVKETRPERQVDDARSRAGASLGRWQEVASASPGEAGRLEQLELR